MTVIKAMFILLILFSSCSPARDAEDDFWKTHQVRKRITAKKIKHGV